MAWIIAKAIRICIRCSAQRYFNAIAKIIGPDAVKYIAVRSISKQVIVIGIYIVDLYITIKKVRPVFIACKARKSHKENPYFL